MKKIVILTLITLLAATSIKSQAFGVVNANGTSNQITFIKRDKIDETEKFKKIAHKMYLTDNYIACKVDSINETVFLKYNIYKDQMEFEHNNQVLFLKKEKGRKIVFQYTKEDYRLFDFENELKYFQVIKDGKNQLLRRQIVTYSEAKPAASSYQKAKPAAFNREKDKFYIRFENKNIVEVPSRKKQFYSIFSSHANEIKKYVKSNKLNIKRVSDLEKVVSFYNTL